MLWIEFVREVRWCWEELQPLPKMPVDASIDLSTCLINQKLKMVLNSCSGIIYNITILWSVDECFVCQEKTGWHFGRLSRFLFLVKWIGLHFYGFPVQKISVPSFCYIGYNLTTHSLLEVHEINFC